MEASDRFRSFCCTSNKLSPHSRGNVLDSLWENVFMDSLSLLILNGNRTNLVAFGSMQNQK